MNQGKNFLLSHLTFKNFMSAAKKDIENRHQGSQLPRDLQIGWVTITGQKVLKYTKEKNSMSAVK